MNTKRPKDDLTKREQKTLGELSKRDDIIIKNADKGGSKVIMDIDKLILIKYLKHNASLTTKIVTKNFKQIRLYNTTI